MPSSATDPLPLLFLLPPIIFCSSHLPPSHLLPLPLLSVLLYFQNVRRSCDRFRGPCFSSTSRGWLCGPAPVSDMWTSPLRVTTVGHRIASAAAAPRLPTASRPRPCAHLPGFPSGGTTGGRGCYTLRHQHSIPQTQLITITPPSHNNQIRIIPLELHPRRESSLQQF